MAICETPDFTFPMLADIYYPMIEQGGYGNITKDWVLDRTVAGNFTPAGADWNEEIKPNKAVVVDSVLLGRVKTDIRVSSRKGNNALTNVIITNVRDKNGNPIYVETAGPRAGKSTIFEVATIQPFVGPFGSAEYYKVVIKRSENQAVTV